MRKSIATLGVDEYPKGDYNDYFSSKVVLK